MPILVVVLLALLALFLLFMIPIHFAIFPLYFGIACFVIVGIAIVILIACLFALIFDWAAFALLQEFHF